MNKKKVIQLQGISKIYQASDVETLAMNNISLDILEGDYAVISGPSGGGKSSMLSVMGLLDRFNSGKYLFQGQDVSNMSKSELSRIRNTKMGFIFQSFNLIDSLNVRDNVILPIRYRNDISNEERNLRVNEALKTVGLEHRMKHLPGQLSGGQQQRVAVARAIVGKPAIILADEPTGNLDSKSADVVMNLLAEQHRDGVTICMVTHDPRYTTDATRVIEVLDGSVTSNKDICSSVENTGLMVD